MTRRLTGPAFMAAFVVAAFSTLSGGTAAAQSGPTEVHVVETLVVVDIFALTPPLSIPVLETLAVVDIAHLQPPTIIERTEELTVSDSATLSPPHLINVVEHGTIADSPALRLPYLINIVEHASLIDAVVVTPLGLVPVPAVGFAGLALISAALAALTFFKARRSKVGR
ncbi:MAG: hypothetical protein FJ319_13445 [SAR202 cluster bacterium]|nr:hypothetical protein [SAR202 cluster bacterium]